MAKLPVGSYIYEDKKYKRLFKEIRPVVDAPDMVRARQAEQLEASKPKPSLLDKAVGVAQSAIEPVSRIGTGIVRSLPGGTSDLDAAERASEQQAQDIRGIMEQLKGKSLTKEQRKRLVELLKQRAATSENQTLRDLSTQIQDEVDRSAFLGAMAGVGSMFIPVAKGAQVLRGGTSATKALGVSAGGGAVGGAGFTAAADPEVELKDMALGALAGGAVGAAFPLAGAAFNRAAGQTVSEFGKEVAKRLTPREFAADKFANRLFAFNRSDVKTAKAMVKRGEVTSKKEGLNKLRAEGRSLEQIADEYLASATKASLFFAGKTSAQAKNKQSMLDLFTKSRAKGTETQDNQFAIDMFDLEVRNKPGGRQLQAEPAEDVLARTEAYKKANPTWEQDLKTRKEYLDGLLDIDVKSGGIDKATADFIKKSYDTPAPIDRLFDEDGLIRPEITGGVKNVGKDTIARFIEGGVRDIDKTYAPYLARALNAYRQDSRNRLRAEIDRRVRAGELKGTQHVKAETTRARNKLRDSIDELDKELKSVNTLIRRQAANQRVAKARAVGVKKTQKAVVKGEERTGKARTAVVSAKEKAKINAANKRLATSTKKVINNLVATRKKSALADETTANSMQLVDNVVNKMTQKELIQLSEGISGSKSIDEIRKSIAQSVAREEKARSAAQAKVTGKKLTAEEKTQQAQKIVDDTTAIVDALRSHREALKQGKREIRENISGLSEVAPSHNNVIKYLESGDVVVTELDKGMLKSLQNLESSTKAEDIIRFLNIPSQTVKAGWTSNPLLAPGFLAAKAIFNSLLTVNVSKGGRELFNPKAIVQAVKPSFRRAIHERGAIAEGATSTARKPVVSIDALGAGRLAKSPVAGVKSIGSLLTSKEGIRATLSKLNSIGGFVDNAYRSWSASATEIKFFKQYLKQGLPEGQAREQALRQAAVDYNEVLGNLQRTTNTVRGLEAVLPYSQAGQAGVGAFARAIKERPGETIPKLAITASVLGAGAYNFFRDPNAVEFVQEQYEAGRASQVDGWVFIPDPFSEDGLRKVDDGDGKHHWEGAWKVRLPADFRPIMGMFNRGLYDEATGENTLTDDFVYGAIAQLGLGGIGGDAKKTEFNPMEAVRQGSIGILGSILFGKHPDTGEELKTWGDKGVALSNELGQTVGWLTDYGNALVNEDGEFDMQEENTGDFLAAALQRWGKGIKTIPSKLFKETAGVSAGSKIYREIRSTLKGVKDTTLADYQKLHAFDEDDNSSGLFYNPTRAQMLLDNPDLFALEKKVAEIRNRYNGKPIDPIFNIKNKKHRNTILSIQAVPVALRDGSNIPSDVYDSAYYSKYQDDRDEYYKQKAEWNEVMGYENTGDSDYPVPTKDIEKKVKYYYSLPSYYKKGYRNSNPDLLAHLRAKEDWSNKQRQRYTDATGVPLKLEDYY